MEKLEIQFKEEQKKRQAENWLAKFVEKHKSETREELELWLYN